MRHDKIVSGSASVAAIPTDNHFKPALVLLLASLMVFLVSGTARSGQASKGTGTWKATSMTLYKSMALVRDSDSVQLEKGKTSLFFHPVSGKIIPQSTVISCDDATVLEQTFISRPLTPNALLKSYIGKEVILITTDKITGIEKTVPAKLLSADGGIVLKVNGRIETTIPGRIAFPGLPDGLGNEPVLKVAVRGEKNGKSDVAITYLTRGISWRTDYIAVLSANEKNMDIESWVTVNNNSGIAFKDASIQLVAGDVNEEPSPPPVPVTRTFAKSEAVMSASSPDVNMENLFEYHLYSINRPISIDKDSQKEIALFRATDIPCRKEFLVIGSKYSYSRKMGYKPEKLPMQAIITFKNDEASRLGQPMPKGMVRVYKKDSANRLQFIGRDNIRHMPKGAEINLSLGKAFDIVCTKVQTDFRKLAGNSKYNSVYESSYSITVKNTRSEPARIRFLEPFSGTWTITSETMPHKKTGAHTAMWHIDVPANGQKVLKFTARVRY